MVCRPSGGNNGKRGINYWEEMKCNMSGGIWHERLCGRSRKMLWDEVERQRGLTREEEGP
jgi:hypothetical protein